MKTFIEWIKKWIAFWIALFFTILFLGIWYAAITNVWTDTSTLEVSSSSTLTANSWNKLLWNFESLSWSINATPIIWSWAQASNRTGTWKFVWDSQILNTDTSSLWWVAWQDYININKAWYYKIYADVLWWGIADNQRQDAYMYKNTTSIAISLWMWWVSQTYYKHVLVATSYFNVWDKVSVGLSLVWDRYWLSVWSKLTIEKLD